MRVAQLVCSDGFAGVERYLVSLGRELAALGVDSIVIGGDVAQMTAELAGSGVSWLPGNSMAQAARSLSGLRVDLVNAHMTQAEVVALAVRSLGRTPVVSTRHFAATRGSHPVARAVGAVVDRRLAAQIAISEYVADHAGTRTEVVHSGVPETYDTVLATGRAPYVLVAQRLEAEKQTRVALEAWAAATVRRRGWRLKLAGSGSEEPAMRALADELGIATSVDFLGHRGDVPDLMRDASILVATTPIEGLGLTVLEAMSQALPVVATAAGGHLESLGSVGKPWAFAPGDAAGAAELIDVLAGDAPMRDTLGRGLQQRQREFFTVRRQAERTLALYGRVLS